MMLPKCRKNDSMTFPWHATHILLLISFVVAFAPNDRLPRKRIASEWRFLESNDGRFLGMRNRSQPKSTRAHASPSSASELERMKDHLKKLQQQQRLSQRALDYHTANVVDPMAAERERIYQSYILRPASDLKQELTRRQLNNKGRKPELAQRLTQDDLLTFYGLMDHGKEEGEYLDEVGFGPSSLVNTDAAAADESPISPPSVVTSFAGLYSLSEAASSALTNARFVKPSKIQAKAIPVLSAGESAILHAATGSGKTLAYLLPLTERLWSPTRGADEDVAFVLTPTRELAAQVANVATVLAPPGTVRFVNRPSNLMCQLRQESALVKEDTTTIDRNTLPRIYVGSANAIYESLYGDGKMPASPTPKPQAMFLLKNTAYFVLDEVDRLLDVVGGSSSIRKYSVYRRSEEPPPEQPAAILTAAVARLTLGKAVMVAASATVGRPLRRELARCLGLSPQECPPIIREDSDDEVAEPIAKSLEPSLERDTTTASSIVLGRSVTIPNGVSHYIIPVEDGASPGKVLTTAYSAIQSLGTAKRMLLILTRNFGFTTQNAIGALKHFKCQPEPISLLDALETTEGTEAMMQLHQKVSGVSGIGGTAMKEGEDYSLPQARGYLLVTTEDTIRGLHLDGLDVVLVAARSAGPDEYTHIAGRTGRAGRSGHVVNIVGQDDVQKIKAWEKMLNVRFRSCINPKAIAEFLKNVEE